MGVSLDDIEVLQSQLPDAFEKKVPPQKWLDDWHVIEVSNADKMGGDELWEVGDGADVELRDEWTRWTEPPIATTSPLPVGIEWPDDFPGRPRVWQAPPDSQPKVVPVLLPPPECLAFYLPFHYYYPDWWGVYLFAEGVGGLAKCILQVGKLKITDEVARRVARLFLYAHESFHHQTEAFATRLEVTHRIAVFRTAFTQLYKTTYGSNACQEEALANAHALRTVKRALQTHPQGQSIQETLKKYVEACPPGYRRGTQYVTGSAFAKGRCHFAEDNQKLAVPHAGSRAPSIWQVFPHAFSGISRINSRVNYVVRRNSPLAKRLKLDARYLRYRELTQKLSAKGCRCVRQGKGAHEIWQGPSGAQRPITIHGKDMPVGTVLGIVKGLGLNMTWEELKS